MIDPLVMRLRWLAKNSSYCSPGILSGLREAADRITELEIKNEKLTRRLAAQSADAARYRFAFIESPEWTFAVCKWDGEDWLPIQDNTEIDAAMQAGKEPK